MKYQLLSVFLVLVGLTQGLPKFEKELVIKNELKSLPPQLCDDCLKLVGDIRQIMLGPGTQAMVKQEVDQLCSLIPDQFGRDECKKVALYYVGYAFNITSRYFPDANTICTRYLRLCSAKPLPYSLEYKVQGPTECASCKTVCSTLQTVMRNEEKSAVTFLTQNICTLVPGQLQDVCKQEISTFVPIAFDMVIQYLDPNTACRFMGLCKNSTKLSSVCDDCKALAIQLESYIRSQQTQGQQDFCQTCKDTMGTVKQLVQSYQGIVTNMAKRYVCNYLPGRAAAMCNETIDHYMPVLFELVLNYLNPDTVCRYLGLCRNQAMAAFKLTQATVAKPVKASGATCVMCEFAVGKLQSMLKKNSTVAEIEKAVEQVCNLLPGTIKEECNSFVQEYGPALIKLLAQQVNPEQICTELGLCTSKIVKAVKQQIVGGEACDVCQTALGYLIMALKEKMVADTVEKELENVCNMVPSQMKAQCDGIIEQYTPEILNYIAREASAEKICQAIRVCSSSKPKQILSNVIPAVPNKLLGKDDCTMGPSFWCASVENAKRCQTLAHCKMYVWKR